MRTRKANEEAVQKTITFLRALKLQVETTGELNLPTLVKNHSISATTGKACKALGIIKQDDEGKWHYTGLPDRMEALRVLDHILTTNKKWVNPTLLPDQHGIAKTLADISEKLTVSIDQNNIALKLIKTGNKQTGPGETLFSKDEQHRRDLVYLAGQIGGAIFKNINIDDLYLDQIKNINTEVMNISEDLLSKLEAKQNG